MREFNRDKELETTKAPSAKRREETEDGAIESVDDSTSFATLQIQDDDIHLVNNAEDCNDSTSISDVIHVDPDIIEDIKDNQEKLDTILDNAQDSTESSYEDDEALDTDAVPLMPLELNAFEQVKLFLTDSKNFFNSSFIESVGTAALSTTTLNNPDIQRVVVDIIVIFSRISKNFNEIEKSYGKLTNRSMIDEIIIDSLTKISDAVIAQDIPYSPYMARDIFNEVSNEPKYFTDVTISNEVSEKFNKLIETDISITLSYVKQIQRDLESKLKILDIVKNIQQYSKFLSRDASKCNNITDFIKQYSDIVNSASSSISEVLDTEDSGLTVENVLNHSFFDTIIRTKDVHVKCGLSAFDSITNGGFEKDRVYLFAGKTGGGKSTVLLNVAYGMYKSSNGIFFPEVQLFNKFIESDQNIEIFKNYYDANIKALKEEDRERFGLEYASKKHMILYVTLENTEFETVKRFMCRMGLLSHIFWILIERDARLEKIVRTKGLDFTMNDLPSEMSHNLKRRLFAMSSYIKIMSSNNRTEFKVWWKPPYSISTYDIFMECKRLERQGYIIDAVFIDYPDKMRPIDTHISKADQSWDTLGKIIDNLKGFSKQVSVPVLAVSQLTRQGNKDSGNKNTIIKGGATAGSQQKESNTDTLINMNIHSKDDAELTGRVDMFKNYQRFINQSKSSVVNNLFTRDNKELNNKSSKEKYEYFKKLTVQADRAADILQLAFSMPDVQTISNYIVKNRDGISDIVFETYIVYGMYLVTDYDQEAIDSSKYSVDTYMEIVKYMNAAAIINDQSHQVCMSLYKSFQDKIGGFQASINSMLRQSSGQNMNSVQQKQQYNKSYQNQQQSQQIATPPLPQTVNAPPLPSFNNSSII